MTGAQIVPYHPDLKEELIEFRRAAYETGFPESREYLHWKYDKNPYIDEPLFYIARDAGRIVGMRGMYGTQWEFGSSGNSIVLPCADDFVVAPEYRNTGLVTLIMREALADLARRGYEYVLNTSGGRITVMSSLAAGWRSAVALEPMVRRSWNETLRHAVRTRVRGLRGSWRFVRSPSANIVSSPEPFRRVDRMGRVAVTNGGSIVAERVPRVDEMAQLVARLPYDGRIRHVRNETYLRWRYQNPVRDHRFFYCERDGRLEGYLVVARHVECQLPTLPFHVVDWEGTDHTIRAELLRRATSVGRFSELGTWAAGRPDSDLKLLTRAGFVPTDFDLRKRGMPCFLVRSLRNGPPESWMLGGDSILDSQRWDPRLLYTMHG